MLKISIEVNRNVFVSYEDDPIVKCEFNDFSDASLRAYGATIYFKTLRYQGKFVSISLVKSRIAQRQEITMPRLELLGNLLLALLLSSVKIAT